MDFAAVLPRVGELLAARGVQPLVIGGVALAAYGIARTTVDLAFVVEERLQDGLVAALEQDGYRTLHRSRS